MEEEGKVFFGETHNAADELSIREVSRLTGYASSTLRSLEKDGKIPTSRRINGVRHWTAGEAAAIKAHREAVTEAKRAEMTKRHEAVVPGEEGA